MRAAALSRKAWLLSRQSRNVRLCPSLCGAHVNLPIPVKRKRTLLASNPPPMSARTLRTRAPTRSSPPAAQSSLQSAGSRSPRSPWITALSLDPAIHTAALHLPDAQLHLLPLRDQLLLTLLSATNRSPSASVISSRPSCILEAWGCQDDISTLLKATLSLCCHRWICAAGGSVRPDVTPANVEVFLFTIQEPSTIRALLCPAPALVLPAVLCFCAQVSAGLRERKSLPPRSNSS
jgi:hypothetical protein